MRQRSTENKGNEIKPQQTKGDGDCAFHAALGEWNEKNRQFETNKINEKRKIVADAIRICQTDPILFSLVKVAVIALVMGGINIKGEAFKNLKTNYNDNKEEDDSLIKEKWDAFEKEIRKYPTILSHIEEFVQEYIKSKKLLQDNISRLASSFSERFSTCENEGDETLRALIMSFQELESAYLSYKKLNQGVNIDQWFDNTLLNEYADFILKPGQWLLPCELNIIAHVFDISIDYYATSAATSDQFNPGKEKKVPVCFNGRNHYEQMANPMPLTNTPERIDSNLDISSLNERLALPGYLIELQLEKGFSVKNLSEGFAWNDIPMLAVLTEKNGIGKTAVLETILLGFEKRLLNQKQFDVKLEFNGDLTKRGDIPDIFGFSSATSSGKMRNTSEASAREYAKDIEDTFTNLKKYDSSRRYSRQKPENNKRFDRIIASFEEKFDLSIDSNEVGNRNYQDIFYEGLKAELEKEIGIHISTYGSLEKYPKYLLERETTLENLNSYLEEKGFKYIISLKSYKERQQFDRLVLQEKEKIETVDSDSLSPGERLELLTLLWLFETRTNKESDVGAIFLLDEFDAHLHPGLAKQVIETIKEKLVGEYGVQVIMTTHNPTTVSLVPKQNLFIISNNNPDKAVRIERAKNKKQAIQLLTAGFVCVNEPFRLVFVEAEQDRQFYQLIREKLISLSIISPAQQLLFMAHSKDKKNSSCDLVRSVVENCVEKSQDEDQSLREHIFGLIDGDNKEKPSSRNILTVRRYSIENYILDPVHIFFSIRKKFPKLEAIIEISDAIEKLLTTSSVKIPQTLDDIFNNYNEEGKSILLQTIADGVMNQLKNGFQKMINENSPECQNHIALLREKRFSHLLKDGQLNWNMEKIKFVGGIELEYSQFILEFKGHNLEHLYSLIFPKAIHW